MTRGRSLVALCLAPDSVLAGTLGVPAETWGVVFFELLFFGACAFIGWLDWKNQKRAARQRERRIDPVWEDAVHTQWPAT